MKFNAKYIPALLMALLLPAFYAGESSADNTELKNVTECFESREGYTKIQKNDKGRKGYAEVENSDGTLEADEGYWSNIKCSDRTGGVLWWSDPKTGGTVPMGDMPDVEADYLHAEAFVRPRIPQLSYYMPCSACHNGQTVPVPTSKRPRTLYMHQDIVPNSMEMKHGRGAIWCLDCHNAKNRDTLINHFGDEISFNQPQKLCGKCHGQILRDWRDGIHGKRIGSWKDDGPRRWWVCTECHNPHDVQPPFKQLSPEAAPELPKNMKNADHEVHHHPGEEHEESADHSGDKPGAEQEDAH